MKTIAASTLVLLAIPLVLGGCAKEAETAPAAEMGGCPHTQMAMAADSATTPDSTAIPMPCTGGAPAYVAE